VSSRARAWTQTARVVISRSVVRRPGPVLRRRCLLRHRHRRRRHRQPHLLVSTALDQLSFIFALEAALVYMVLLLRMYVPVTFASNNKQVDQLTSLLA
jgi:hypothetical protein